MSDVKEMEAIRPTCKVESVKKEEVLTSMMLSPIVVFAKVFRSYKLQLNAMNVRCSVFNRSTQIMRRQARVQTHLSTCVRSYFRRVGVYKTK